MILKPQQYGKVCHLNDRASFSCDLQQREHFQRPLPNLYKAFPISVQHADEEEEEESKVIENVEAHFEWA